jgi:hypothetical protein
MASPAGILRYLRRKIGGFIFFTRHVEEDTEALYGPNPNDSSPDEKIRRMGPGGGLPPVLWWRSERSAQQREDQRR